MFQLNSLFKPSGDQPQAIETLTQGILQGKRYQTLKGVTGSGKTFTMANVISRTARPALILSHNKTLAAQLYREFKEFFPHNAVEYFVSYYDYYQPEAYIPSRDLYIEKESSINEEIERLRGATAVSLLTRRDVIVVATVSCIYGFTPPDFYRQTLTYFEVGKDYNLDELTRRLSQIHYERNQVELNYGTYQIKGDTIYISPAYMSGKIVRLSFDFETLSSIEILRNLTLEKLLSLQNFGLYSSEQFVTPQEQIAQAIRTIGEELEEVYEDFNAQGKIVEAQRIRTRTLYDMEMLQETQRCSGVENYTKHLTGREAGSMPYTLFSYFPKDFLLIVDESHVTLPQVRGMYNGDKARKDNLVQFGFRLPSARENRPLIYEEFETCLNQVIYVSATPGPEELQKTHNQVVEQIIRPTGLLDPIVEVRPSEGQMHDMYGEIVSQIQVKGKVFITTLTKKMSEELTNYLANLRIRVRYLHSEIDTFERAEILTAMRKDEIDVIVGINLLREGLDIPEVSLVCILDADKIGFLRSATSLIQTIGRAARNERGKVIMYADRVSVAMEQAINETNCRRQRQMRFNQEHGIIPRSVSKEVKDILINQSKEKISATYKNFTDDFLSEEEREVKIKEMETSMKKAARARLFEEAAFWRDEIEKLKKV